MPTSTLGKGRIFLITWIVRWAALSVRIVQKALALSQTVRGTIFLTLLVLDFMAGMFGGAYMSNKLALPVKYSQPLPTLGVFKVRLLKQQRAQLIEIFKSFATKTHWAILVEDCPVYSLVERKYKWDGVSISLWRNDFRADAESSFEYDPDHIDMTISFNFSKEETIPAEPSKLLIDELKNELLAVSGFEIKHSSQ